MEVCAGMWMRECLVPVGALYTSPFDCFRRTVFSEGPLALLKGWSAHYLRLGPHVVLTFVFLEQTKRVFAGVDF